MFGFAGFGRNPADPEPETTSAQGVGQQPDRRCANASRPTVNLLIDDGGTDASRPAASRGTPCTNVGNVENGELVPRRSKGNGFTHRLNAQYKPNDDMMFYATWSRGFRPGGINRQPNAASHTIPTISTNYELGWKTTFGPIRWNGAVYHQIWKKFQFSFLGENSLTVIQNGRDARINGIETDVGYVGGGLTLNAAAAYTDAKTKENICNHSDGERSSDDEDPMRRRFHRHASRAPACRSRPSSRSSATARYAWPVGTAGRMSRPASLTKARQRRHSGSNYRHAADVVDPNDFLGRIKPSTLVDLFAGFDWQRYSIELSPRTSSTSATSCRASLSCSICYARPRSCQDVRGRSGLGVGAKF